MADRIEYVVADDTRCRYRRMTGLHHGWTPDLDKATRFSDLEAAGGIRDAVPGGYIAVPLPAAEEA